MAPGKKQRPSIIPKQLEENLNPGQIVVELKLTLSNIYLTNFYLMS